tara:strand:- start:11705 stop:12838 length:1134 start_codon:yes stop_codon:yes gene_type:complete
MIERIGITLLGLVGAAFAQDAPAFRTDASTDDSLPWFQIVDGEFPPEGSAHYFSGELIGIDPVNRKGTLRVDRTDQQRRSHWDLPVDFKMLPYGAIWLHGSPAELRQVPIGTHLHGWFYEKGPDEEVRTVFHNRASIEANFTRCFRLEDDFSYQIRQGRDWRVDVVNLEEGKLTVTGMKGDVADEKATEFDLLPSARIWKGNGFGTLADLAAGQRIQVNLTWATLYGPGRCIDIWLDAESQAGAKARMAATYEQHLKERGFAGWVDAVDNPNRVVTVTFFDQVDPKLFEDFNKGASVTALVAEPSLRSYDQVNDRKRGPLLEMREVPNVPGSSGVQIDFQPELLLEGFRPGRIVRILPERWPLISIPQEERLWPARD